MIGVLRVLDPYITRLDLKSREAPNLAMGSVIFSLVNHTSKVTDHREDRMAGPQVQTKYGIVEGARENDQNVFRGIPFAKPPINELRWCAPEEPESWEGVKVCTEFSAVCAQ